MKYRRIQWNPCFKTFENWTEVVFKEEWSVLRGALSQKYWGMLFRKSDIERQVVQCWGDSFGKWFERCIDPEMLGQFWKKWFERCIDRNIKGTVLGKVIWEVHWQRNIEGRVLGKVMLKGWWSVLRGAVTGKYWEKGFGKSDVERYSDSIIEGSSF